MLLSLISLINLEMILESYPLLTAICDKMVASVLLLLVDKEMLNIILESWQFLVDEMIRKIHKVDEMTM